MKDLIIVGAGGFGREAYYLAKTLGKWNIKGFIDDAFVDPKDFNIDLPLLGTIKDWQPSENEEFAMGIASPRAKEKVSTILKERGAKFATMIHPAALVNETAHIGEGCIVGGRSSIGACTTVGNFVHVAGSMIGQDAMVGDFTTTTGFANLTNAIIGRRVFVGSHAVILNKLKVGDDAYICAGSIVFSKVKAGTKVIGNPAKRMDF